MAFAACGPKWTRIYLLLSAVVAFGSAQSCSVSAQTRRTAAIGGWHAEVVPAPHAVHSRRGPLAKSATRLVKMKSAPFPYDGVVPSTGQPFLETAEDGRRFHRTPRGRIYWEDEHYSDPRVLLHLPKGFDIRRPGLIIVYFHGHGATLKEDVFNRQKVVRQVARSGINAALIAPQLAVKAADSSPGKLWEPGGFARLVAESAQRLARMHGDPRSEITFNSLPIVIVAYSGGYVPTAWSVRRGGLGKRLHGVVLFDALYAEMEAFETWIARDPGVFFISTYTSSTKRLNMELQTRLQDRGIPVVTALDGRLRPGTIAFMPAASGTNHRDFLTRAWADDPLKELLARVRGYSRS